MLRSRERATIAIAAALVGMLLAAPVGAAKASRSGGSTHKTPSKLMSFQLGVDDSGFIDPILAPVAIERAQEIHARFARVAIPWTRVVSSGAVKPAGFDARSASDPHYHWSLFDAEITRLTQAGFTVFVTLVGAPRWAQQGNPPDGFQSDGGPWKPRADDYGDFAFAAATRYSGRFVDPVSGAALPRVRYWQAWNEPNLPMALVPTSPDLYRTLLNSFYDSVKSVQKDSIVISAGLAPVKSSANAAFPKRFAERLLCIRPKHGWYVADRSCPARARFDVFSIHPYSLGAQPTQPAAIPGNVFVADVGDIALMLRAAQKLKRVYPVARKQLWTTEFAWFTNPPNTSIGVSPRRAAKNVLESLYQLWRFGVSRVAWFAVSDSSDAMVKGGGFYDAVGRAKPTRDALRFPFWIDRSRKSVVLWGSAPRLEKRPVSLQRRTPRGWKTIARVTPRRDGLFWARLKLRIPRATTVRVKQGSASSITITLR